jgi:alkyl sulfatase BDS1-like metallo-beta-lactamase superfamily hydrolase
VFQIPARPLASADTLAGLSTDVFFDALAIRLDPAKAAGQSFVLNWRFTDRNEEMTLTLKHCTLTHRMGERAETAAASVTTSRATLDALVLRKTTAPEALMSGALKVEGDASKFAQLFGMLDQPGGLMFDVLTPGEDR